MLVISFGSSTLMRLGTVGAGDGVGCNVLAAESVAPFYTSEVPQLVGAAMNSSITAKPAMWRLGCLGGGLSRGLMANGGYSSHRNTKVMPAQKIFAD